MLFLLSGNETARFPNAYDNSNFSVLVWHRRSFLKNYLAKNRNVQIISTAASPILGQPNCLTSENAEMLDYIQTSSEKHLPTVNQHTH